MQFAVEKYRVAKNTKPTESAEALWEIYSKQQNGNKKKEACRYGHPRIKENVICRWVIRDDASPYVRADCRICTSKRVHKNRTRGADVFDVASPGTSCPKEQERLRIELALLAYNRQQQASTAR